MKLIYRIVIRISVVLTVVLMLWAGFFYYTMIDEINDEVDDVLENYSEQIMVKWLQGDSLPSVASGSNNQYFLSAVSGEYAERRPHIVYADSMIYIAEKDETEPARILTSIFQDSEGEFYQLKVFTPTFEKHDLMEAILMWVILLYSVLLISIILIIAWVLYANFKPLRKLLKWLDAYRIGTNNVPLKNNTKITEFKRLNESLLRYVTRAEVTFEQQKQFIGNASHEMQTPLAICRNRLEMLIEETDFSDAQQEEIIKIYQTIERLIRLNKTLLLLSKIDNYQYLDKKEVNIGALITGYIEDYKEMFEPLGITVDIERKGDFLLYIDESLATILASNLLKNAYIHNKTGGYIRLLITPSYIEIANTSHNVEPLDHTKIFERFYQGDKKENSTGLGLSLVSAICRNAALNIEYSFDEPLNIFRITRK